MRIILKNCAILLVSFGILTLFNIGLLSQEKDASEKKPSPVEVEAVTKWIAANAIPLKSVEAGQGFKDLEPLKKILKDTRIVALGEATHGTREFFQFKHRMLEFLVEEMGFTVFAIEASYPACLNINDYVLYGKGDRAEALASQKFWTWDTNEVTDMIEWMRKYNLKVPEEKKVKFMGYDLQHLGQAIELVESYLKKVAPKYVETAVAAIDPVRIDPFKIATLPQQKEEEKALILSRFFEMIGFLAFNQTRFIRMTSVEEFELVMQHARTLVQFYDAYSKSMMDPKNPARSAGALRDFYMAENIEYIMNSEGPDTKIAVWAHNGHISTHSWGGSIPAMGAHLRKIYGDSYYALGFAFNKGGFQSRNMDKDSDQHGALVEFNVGPAPEGALGWYLSQSSLGNYILDFRSAPAEGKIAAWLKAPHPMRSIGAGFADKWKGKYLAPTVLRHHFDGIVFISDTTRARPNPTGKRGPFKKKEKAKAD